MTRSFRVGHTGSASSLPLVHAFHEGYFSDAGLQLQLVREIGLRTLMEGCITGRIEAACLPALTPVINSQQRDDTDAPWAVLAVLSRGGFDLVLKTSVAQRLRTPRFTLGETLRIGVPPTPTCAPRLVRQWHQSLGLSNQPEPRCLPVPPEQMSAFLAEEVVDGVCAPAPFADILAGSVAAELVANSATLHPGHINGVVACPPSSSLRAATSRRLFQTALARAAEECAREIPAWMQDRAATGKHFHPVLVEKLSEPKSAEKIRRLLEPNATSPAAVTAADRQFIEESCFACADAVVHPRLLRKLIDRIYTFPGVELPSRSR